MVRRALLAALALLPLLLIDWGESSDACDVDPISLEQLNAVIEQAEPPPAVARVPAGGVDALPDEARTFRSLIEQFVACSNAGEPLRVMALYTDRYLGELYYRQGRFSAELYTALAEPRPAAPDEQTAIVSIARVLLLPDGFVAGTVTLRYARVPMPKELIFTTVLIDDEWRIDDVLGELSFSLP